MKKKNGKEELKELFKSVKEVLVKKGLVEGEVLAKQKQKEEAFIPQEPKERRRFPRLNLTRDFNRTVILKIEYPERSENIKSFANNISLGGIALETKKELRESDKINLRLFFYGNRIPMMKIQAHVIWRKKAETINYYGASFDLMEEKNRKILNDYIESNIAKSSS